MKPNVSIVICTYNRRESLLKVLNTYKQRVAAEGILELLVVDDGSTDGTQGAIREASVGSPFPIRCLPQDHAALAAARNHGVREARGEIVLFTDDDVIPSRDMVAEHLAWHKDHQAAGDTVLGRVLWSREINPTPFMRWLERDSDSRLHPGPMGDPAFIGWNISVKRNFLLENGLFDEEFKIYGLEDIEFGRRMMKKGMRIYYSPDALGYHYKRMSMADVWRREETVERVQPLFRAKLGITEDPDSFEGDSTAKKGIRKLVRGVLPLASPVLRLFDTHMPLPSVVYRLFYYHYIVPTARARVHAEERKIVPSLDKAEQGAE